MHCHLWQYFAFCVCDTFSELLCSFYYQAIESWCCCVADIVNVLAFDVAAAAAKKKKSAFLFTLFVCSCIKEQGMYWKFVGSLWMRPKCEPCTEHRFNTCSIDVCDRLYVVPFWYILSEPVTYMCILDHHLLLKEVLCHVSLHLLWNIRMLSAHLVSRLMQWVSWVWVIAIAVHVPCCINQIQIVCMPLFKCYFIGALIRIDKMSQS